MDRNKRSRLLRNIGLPVVLLLMALPARASHSTDALGNLLPLLAGLVALLVLTLANLILSLQNIKLKSAGMRRANILMMLPALAAALWISYQNLSYGFIPLIWILIQAWIIYGSLGKHNEKDV